MGVVKTTFHITISGTSASSVTSSINPSEGTIVGATNAARETVMGTGGTSFSTIGINSVCIGGSGPTYLTGMVSTGISYGNTSYFAVAGASYPHVTPLGYATCTGGGASVLATTNTPDIQFEGYRELSETLAELNTSQDDEWKIESEVYDTSIQVAAALFDKDIPTPHVFSHGPRSVVFNWSDGENNLYLTVGKRRLWAAVSSASEIKTRVELTGPTNNVAGDFVKALTRSLSNRPMLSYDRLEEAS